GGRAPPPPAPPTPPASKTPSAPPPEPIAARAPAPSASPAAPAAPPAIKIPLAPPADDEAEAADAQAGVEKKFAANDTLGAVLAREGFGSAGPNVIAALAKLGDLRAMRPGTRYVVRVGDDGTPEAFEYQPTPALRYLVERDDDADAAVHRW